MSYRVFQDKCNAIARRAGSDISVNFSHDEDKGRFIARFSDNTRIVANETSSRVSVLFGSHQAMANI